MNPGEKIDQTIVREVKEETGLDVTVEDKIGEYVEKGIKDGVEYEYYPTCFLFKPAGGKIKSRKLKSKKLSYFINKRRFTMG
jgi:8-oxo-dGTP pyrophosphatase MutT (NUDIX family)